MQALSRKLLLSFCFIIYRSSWVLSKSLVLSVSVEAGPSVINWVPYSRLFSSYRGLGAPLSKF